MKPLVEELAAPRYGGIHFASLALESGEIASLRASGLVVASAEAPALPSKSTVLDVVAKSLEFPPDFGRNWDALIDYLRDLSWLPADGYVCQVINAGALFRSEPEIVGGLIDAWLFVGEARFAAGMPWHLVFVLDENRDLLPRGAD